MSYTTEEELVLDLVASLLNSQTVLPTRAVTREFSHRQGRADVVSVSLEGEVIAFEAKLTRWRDALTQAYRNTSFAHRSYVVLPSPAAERVSEYAGEFERRRIGLCTLRAGELHILHAAPAGTPLSPWLSAAAARRVVGEA